MRRNITVYAALVIIAYSQCEVSDLMNLFVARTIESEERSWRDRDALEAVFIHISIRDHRIGRTAGINKSFCVKHMIYLSRNEHLRSVKFHMAAEF
jgi:hypothetical protein